MTQEEKDLLLKDLCARLPYNTMVFVHDLDVEDYDTYIHPDIIANLLVNRIWKVKPYLRPMSSMTEEELNELRNYSELLYDNLELSSFQNGTYKCLDFHLSEIPSGIVIKVFDWLNAHHFDYRGLIVMGLAIEAPEGMYKIK